MEGESSNSKARGSLTLKDLIHKQKEDVTSHIYKITFYSKNALEDTSKVSSSAFFYFMKWGKPG